MFQNAQGFQKLKTLNTETFQNLIETKSFSYEARRCETVAEF